MARSIYITSDENTALRVGRERYRNGPCTLTITTGENYPGAGKSLVAVLRRDLPGSQWCMTMNGTVTKFKTEKAAICAMFDKINLAK